MWNEHKVWVLALVNFFMPLVLCALGCILIISVSLTFIFWGHPDAFLELLKSIIE